MLGVFGIVAGVLQGLFYVPYVRDVVRGSTRPHRGTWAIWCALSLIVLTSQRADGGRWSLLVVVAQFAGAATISVLAIDRGVGGTSRLDLSLAAIAIAGLLGWYALGSPTLATLSVVVADGVAVLMMLPKTYTHPYSETLSAFVLSAFSGLFAMAAVGTADFSLLLYPMYFVIADLAVIGLIGLRRREIADGLGTRLRG